MPASNKKSTTKKKQSFFARLKPTTKKAKILTTVAAFAIIGGGIMVFRSFAATTANYTGGVMNWSWDGSRKYTNRVSSNGTLCIQYLAYNLDPSGNGGGTNRFAVRLFTLVNGKWVQSREYMETSSSDLKRTNFQTTCYRKLTSAYVYRVQFDPISDAGALRPDRTWMRLTYKIHGYDVERGETSATSKNPNNTEPAPEPVPVANPQPSK
mgnify:CR=1 FL=1